MNRIIVQPGGKDRRVPVENLRGTYFEHDVPREVYDTPYIRKCLDVGDLVEVKTKKSGDAPASADAAEATAAKVEAKTAEAGDTTASADTTEAAVAKGE